MKFAIRMQDIHNKSGKSKYRVVKDTGLTAHTINRYVESDIYEVKLLPRAFFVLAKYYGVDWKELVEVVDEE